MSMKFDFRTKLLVIVLTMSLVAVLTSDILIYTLFGVLSVYLIIQGFGRQTIKYLIVCGIFIVLRLLSGGQGITILMPEMFLFMVLRILMMAAQPKASSRACRMKRRQRRKVSGSSAERWGSVILPGRLLMGSLLIISL